MDKASSDSVSFGRQFLSVAGKSLRDPYFYFVPCLLGFVGMLAVGSSRSSPPTRHPSELENRVAYCSQLLEKAGTDEALQRFVYDSVTIPNGTYQGESCREVLKESGVTGKYSP